MRVVNGELRDPHAKTRLMGLLWTTLGDFYVARAGDLFITRIRRSYIGLRRIAGEPE